MEQFGFHPTGATQLFEDSRAVHCMAENPVNRKASRHIDTRKHFIGELVENGTIKLKQCKTDKMVADATQSAGFQKLSSSSAYLPRLALA